MQDMLLDYYLWLKALHVVSVIAWMVSMLYLPRLFVYHAQAEKGSVQSETFKTMERRLLRLISNPAMIAAFLFGGLMIWADPGLLTQGWLHVKLTAVFLLAGFHGACARWYKDFNADRNEKPARFFRLVNELPTLLMIVIVIMVIVKPF